MTGIVGSTSRAARIACSISCEVGERLEDERSTPPSLSACDLLAEDRARFVEARRAVRLEADAERADGAGDERRRRRAASRASSRRGAIDLAHLRLEPVLRELEPVRAEGVRLEHLRAGLHVRAVHVAHEIGRAEVQLVVALVDEHALAVQHRPHRAVEDDDALRVEQLARSADSSGNGGLRSGRGTAAQPRTA